MKKVIKHINKKLFQISTHNRKLTEWSHSEINNIDHNVKNKSVEEKQDFFLKVQTDCSKRSVSGVSKYLMENLPEKSINMKFFVKQVSIKTGFKESIVERALNRLILDGKLYQPKPDMIARI